MDYLELFVKPTGKDRGILKTILSEILNQDLGMRRMAAFIPGLLIEDQQNYRDLETIRNRKCSRKSLPATSHGFIAIILRQNPNLRSGRCLKSKNFRRRTKTCGNIKAMHLLIHYNFFRISW